MHTLIRLLLISLTLSLSACATTASKIQSTSRELTRSIKASDYQKVDQSIEKWRSIDIPTEHPETDQLKLDRKQAEASFLFDAYQFGSPDVLDLILTRFSNPPGPTLINPEGYPQLPMQLSKSLEKYRILLQYGVDQNTVLANYFFVLVREAHWQNYTNNQVIRAVYNPAREHHAKFMNVKTLASDDNKANLNTILERLYYALGQNVYTALSCTIHTAQVDQHDYLILRASYPNAFGWEGEVVCVLDDQLRLISSRKFSYAGELAIYNPGPGQTPTLVLITSTTGGHYAFERLLPTPNPHKLNTADRATEKFQILNPLADFDPPQTDD